MIRRLRIAVGCIVAVCLGGCGAFDSRVEWVSGSYEVLWIDEPADSHLAYRLTTTASTPVVSACVSAVAENADYIAVRQRLRVAGADERFVILPKQRYRPMADTASIVIGPLSAAQYAQVSSRLALPALTSVGVPDICNGASRLSGGPWPTDPRSTDFKRLGSNDQIPNDSTRDRVNASHPTLTRPHPP